MGAGNVTDDEGRVLHRLMPPHCEPLPDEMVPYVEFVRDVYGPAELAAATAAVADVDTRRAMHGAALEHLARCRDRLQAGDGSPAARLRRALGEWANAWERADRSASRASVRIRDAGSELERIATERLKGMVPGLGNMTSDGLAALDAARLPVAAR